MTLLIPWLLVTTSFLLATWTVFTGLLITTTDQNDAMREATAFHEERLDSLVSISSTALSGDGHTATVSNRSEGVSFGDYSKLDVFARYVSASGDTVAKRLAYPSEWNVASISPDTSGVNVWDPGEVATLYFTLSPSPRDCNKGAVVIAVPRGISDSAYFDVLSCNYYWNNDPTPPTGDTASHAVLPMSTSSPSATTLYNYDTDRDTDAGLIIKKGGSGVDETNAAKYQVWRTGALDSALLISGDVFVEFWTSLVNFKQNVAGEATIFLRDYDGASGYVEIGNGVRSDSDWQGGSSTFVKKTITIPGLSYTIPKGHQLEVKVIVGSGTGGNMWWVYDTTTYPSVINLP